MARGSEARAEDGVPDPESLPAHLRERRDRIVHAAVALLEHGEYDKIQIRHVAEEADVALGTLYRYFTSKEHLYAAALLQWAEGFSLDRVRSDSGPQTDEARLRLLLRRAIKAFERRPQFLRAEIVVESSTDENARALFDQFAARHNAAMTHAIRDAPADVADAIVETTGAVMGGKLRSWALGRCTIRDVERAVERAVDVIYSPPPS